jgi:hypothetical protein
MLAELFLKDPAPAVRWGPVAGHADTFGVSAGGACEPGAPPTAAKRCYSQLNNGVLQDGTYFLTAFAGGEPPETLLGVGVQSGAVGLEQVHSHGGNVIDMAWVSWER